MRGLVLCAALALCTSLTVSVPHGAAATPANKLGEQCRRYVLETLRDERDTYRRVQYGEPPSRLSVLGTSEVKTSELVPYLVLNYHALSCRLRALCEAVKLSQGHVKTQPVPGNRPLGCARLFAARGRWWSEDRREKTYNESIIQECAFAANVDEYTQSMIGVSDFLISQECTQMVYQILEEERQMLRLIVAQDSTERGARRVAGVLSSVLHDVRSNFLEPLRGLVDLFGAVIHPIPCLLTQCD